MGLVRNYKNSPVAKSVEGTVNAREQQVAHRRSFGGLMDAVEEEMGMPLEQGGAPYWDPMGFLTNDNSAIDLKSRLYEKWKPHFEKFNEKVRQGASIKHSVEEVCKSMERADFSMPVFFTPDVHITDVEDTPLADTIARTAVQQDTVKVDEISTVGSASSFNEYTGSQNWPENDDSTNSHSYDVKAYGRRNFVSDFVQLAAQSLRSTRSLTEETQVAAIRQYEERQAIIGQASNIGATANDASGFNSLTDLANTSNINDASGASISVDKVRENNTALRDAGANREDIVHVTSHEVFEDFQKELDDFTRYDSPGDELDFGFEALQVDNTTILESHGAKPSGSEHLLVSFDASTHYMAMLQDVTMHPLARDEPAEQFATDAYGTLVSEAPSRIQVEEGIQPA